MADPRIRVAPGLPVTVPLPPRANVDSAGFTHVSVELVNATADDIVVETTANWFDHDQHSVEGLLSAPRRMTVPAFGNASLESVSPSARAVAFEIRIAAGF